MPPLFHLPFGLGGAVGLFPLPPPEGFPVVLGAFTGFVFLFIMNKDFVMLTSLRFSFRTLGFKWTLSITIN